MIGFQPDSKSVDRNLNWLMGTGHRRGRDGRGFSAVYDQYTSQTWKTTNRSEMWEDINIVVGNPGRMTFVANMRAEPTTEFVLEKTPSDQQPYTLAGWTVVHNGTIANDKELRTNKLSTRIDSAAIVERLAHNTYDLFDDHPGLITMEMAAGVIKKTVDELKGSYAILIMHEDQPGIIFTACNYRPIWHAVVANGVYFASSRNMFPVHMQPVMLKPYTMQMFAMGTTGAVLNQTWTLRKGKVSKKALVVCSGGLDSVVAAAATKAEGYDVELIHFQYGCRAEDKEVAAVQAVAKALDVPLRLFPLPVYKPGDSPLFDANAKVAGGEAGAEFAHEWVPARNLLLLSVATAIAEANGFETIVLGNNLEEAGAYPDNEPEFIDRFNDILDFAVADGKRMKVIMPVGNLMKHEIVKLGLELGAPLHATWSCYRNGEKHCGTCGPCHMRRTAFQINNAKEVIDYAF